MAKQKNPQKYICSFCGKDNESVEKMITNEKKVNICNECVMLCVEILEHDGKPIQIDLGKEDAKTEKSE